MIKKEYDNIDVNELINNINGESSNDVVEFFKEEQQIRKVSFLFIMYNVVKAYATDDMKEKDIVSFFETRKVTYEQANEVHKMDRDLFYFFYNLAAEEYLYRSNNLVVEDFSDWDKDFKIINRNH